MIYNKILTIFRRSFLQPDFDLWPLLPVFFCFGVIFYFSFETAFLLQKDIFLLVFFGLLALIFFLRKNTIFLLSLAVLLILSGSFYADYFKRNFSDSNLISAKLYAEVEGKVTTIKYFQNPANKTLGANITIENPEIFETKFQPKEIKKSKVKKTKKSKSKKTKNQKKKNPKKRKQKKKTDEKDRNFALEAQPELTENNEEIISQKISKRKSKKGSKKRSQRNGENDQDLVVQKDGSNQQNQKLEAQESNSEIQLKSEHKSANIDENLIDDKGAEKIAETSVENSKTRPKKSLKNKRKTDKKSQKKSKKKSKKISQKKIEKNFVNLLGFQDLDREFLDSKNSYQQLSSKLENGRKKLNFQPKKITLNLSKNVEEIQVNDVVFAKVLFLPRNKKLLPHDFDFELDAKIKNIAASGFVIGEYKILQRGQISNFEQWFLALRQEIHDRIFQVLSGDEAAIAEAFLIGSQENIAPKTLEKIRSSGLAHLLSISGFHISLAATIFFFLSRFLLSRSEYLALNFDLKKPAAILAVMAAFFYLKIANSPISAQRAFIAVAMTLAAIFFHQKINAKRSVMFGLLLLVLYNPFLLFSLSFQLSFISILTLGFCYEKFLVADNQNWQRNFLSKIWRYFWAIILISILVQITTAPFLIHTFQSLSFVGFIANIAAIPLTSFVIMPFGFLALFFMPFAMEKYLLLAMAKAISWLKIVANFIGSLAISDVRIFGFEEGFLFLAVCGLMLIFLTNRSWRLLGIAIFLGSFANLFFYQKPFLALDAKQRFFVIYNEKSGAIFSKNLSENKDVKAYLKWFEQKNLVTLSSQNFQTNKCDEKSCEFQLEEKKFLLILQRNKLSDICQKNVDVLVNFSKKYQLPSCFDKVLIKIDNADFLRNGGHFFYLKNDFFGKKDDQNRQKIILKTSVNKKFQREF